MVESVSNLVKDHIKSFEKPLKKKLMNMPELLNMVMTYLPIFQCWGRFVNRGQFVYLRFLIPCFEMDIIWRKYTSRLYPRWVWAHTRSQETGFCDEYNIISCVYNWHLSLKIISAVLIWHRAQICIYMRFIEPNTKMNDPVQHKIKYI